MLRPRAKEAKPLADYKILVIFDTGEKKIYDIKPQLSHVFFAPLIDESLFKTVRANGITIEWDNDIDICPDDLYYGSAIYNG